MNAHIRRAAARVIEVYQAQRNELAKLSEAELRDLIHDSEELRTNRTFSICTAAEINRAAATIILEERP